MEYQTLALGLLALQIAAFGWRINREVQMEGQSERTWLPLSDWLNIAALLSATYFCLITPILSGTFGRGSVTVLAVGFVLMGFYPFSQAGHYRLFSPNGRSKYENGYPWITDQEIAVTFVSVPAAAWTGWAVWQQIPN